MSKTPHSFVVVAAIAIEGLNHTRHSAHNGVFCLHDAKNRKCIFEQEAVGSPSFNRCKSNYKSYIKKVGRVDQSLMLRPEHYREFSGHDCAYDEILYSKHFKSCIHRFMKYTPPHMNPLVFYSHTLECDIF